MTMRRSSVVIALVGLVAATSVGCERPSAQKDALKAIIQHTARTSHRFTYVDQDLDRTLAVSGIVQDTFRYKARLSIDGRPTWDEVVADDAVADRFLEPDLAARLITHGHVTVIPTSIPGLVPSSPDHITTIDALRTHRWAVDPSGAPTLVVQPGDGRHLGDDPFFDAATVWDYVTRAIDASPFVKKYDRDSLEPVYKAAEDKFPKPAKGSSVSRYDLAQQPLPSRSSVRGGTGGSAQQAPPTIPDFRQLSIYVKGGFVIAIRERIDVLDKLKELARNYQLAFPANISAAQQVRLATDDINRLSKATQSEPFRARTMDFELTGIGQSIVVALPTDAVTGSLAIIPFRGSRTAASGSAGASGPVDDTNTTATSAPGP